METRNYDIFVYRMNKKREERLKIHVPAEESESDTDEEETPEQRGIKIFVSLLL